MSSGMHITQQWVIECCNCKSPWTADRSINAVDWMSGLLSHISGALSSVYNPVTWMWLAGCKTGFTRSWLTNRQAGQVGLGDGLATVPWARTQWWNWDSNESNNLLIETQEWDFRRINIPGFDMGYAKNAILSSLMCSTFCTVLLNAVYVRILDLTQKSELKPQHDCTTRRWQHSFVQSLYMAFFNYCFY